MSLTPDQERLLRELAPRMSDRQIARQLGVSRVDVQAARAALATSPVRGSSLASRKTHELAWAAAILVLAFSLRVAHYLQVKAHDPFFADLTVDPRLYHEWAMRLAAGDWLGQGVFFNSPLYPYFLGVLYRIFGSGPEVAHLANVALGTIAVAATWRLARLAFGWREGLVAALLAAVYPMLLYTGGDVLGENLQVPLNALMLLALVAAFARPRLAMFALAGALMGLSALTRPNVLLFGPFILGCLALLRREGVSWRTLGLRAAALSAAGACVVLPVTARNWVRGHDFALVNAQGGVNFYLGNNAEATGRFHVPSAIPQALADDPDEQVKAFTELAEKAEGRSLKPSEVSRYWNGRAWDWIGGHPGDWLSLEARKVGELLSVNEMGDQRSLVLDRQSSWVLRLPLPGFLILMPLALLGFALTLPRRAAHLVLHAFLVSGGLALILYFINARYRLPLLPAAFAFAGAAAVRMADDLRARRLAPFAACAFVAFALAAFANGGKEKDTLAQNVYNLANKLRDQGRLDEAIAQYDKAIALDPSYVSSHNNLATVLQTRPEWHDRAVAEWEKVEQLAERTGDKLHLDRARRSLARLRGTEPPPDSAPPPPSGTP